MKIMNFTDAYHMMGEMWKLYKKYAARKLTDEEVAVFTREVQAVYEKYKSAFARDIVLAVAEEIGRTVNFYRKSS